MLCLSGVRLYERVLVGEVVKAQRCSECGAELRLRSASCPLCGTEPGAEHKPTHAPAEPIDKDSYQSDLRALREQLRRLRDGAEAV